MDRLMNVSFDLFPISGLGKRPRVYDPFDLHDLHDLIGTFARITQKRFRFVIDLSDQFCWMDFQ